jgi:hypothetical protein
MFEPDSTRSPWALCLECGKPARSCMHSAPEMKTCPTWTVEHWCQCPNPKVDHKPWEWLK